MIQSRSYREPSLKKRRSRWSWMRSGSEFYCYRWFSGSEHALRVVVGTGDESYRAGIVVREPGGWRAYRYGPGDVEETLGVVPDIEKARRLVREAAVVLEVELLACGLSHRSWRRHGFST